MIRRFTFARREAIRRLQRSDKLLKAARHRTLKYFINPIEADHGASKQLIRRVRGSQFKRTAYATINPRRRVRRGRAFPRRRPAPGRRLGHCIRAS
jgi:hypothetical protein